MGSKRYGRNNRKTKSINNKILIVCGGKTEKIYFEKHRSSLAKIKLVPCLYDESPLRVVNRAIKEKIVDDYIQVWCVFDKDEFKDFDEAIVKAKKNDIRCAFSNEAFEVWYLLHYKYFDNHKGRSKCIKELEKELGLKYDKVDKEIYDILKGKMDKAIQNAKRAHQEYMYKGGLPSTWCSCTTVYELMDELKKWKK